jgi:hypothetical protein
VNPPTKSAPLDPLWNALDPMWKQLKVLFSEHHFVTIVCAFVILMMTISFYRLLKSISPALVGFVLLLMLGILILHWTQTRTEPPFLKGLIDFLAPFFPAPVYPTHPAK